MLPIPDPLTPNPCFYKPVLIHKSTLVGGFSFGSFQDNLTDSDARLEDEREGGQVPDLKDLAIIDPGLDKACGHMNDEPHPGKAAPSLKPATHVRRQFNSFLGDTQDRFSRHQGERITDLQTFREVFKGDAVFNDQGISQFLKDSEFVAQPKVDRTRTDLVLSKGSISMIPLRISFRISSLVRTPINPSSEIKGSRVKDSNQEL